MIIWSGLGFLVAVIGFGCLLLTEFGVEAAMHDEHYYQTHGWPKLLAFLMAAVIVWPLGRIINRERSGGGHSLFFVPVQYWAPLFVLLGFVFLFVN